MENRLHKESSVFLPKHTLNQKEKLVKDIEEQEQMIEAYEKNKKEKKKIDEIIFESHNAAYLQSKLVAGKPKKINVTELQQ